MAKLSRIKRYNKMSNANLAEAVRKSKAYTNIPILGLTI